MQRIVLHVASALAIGYVFFKYLLDFVMPFLIGFGVALLIEPLVRVLVRRGRFGRGLASFVALLILGLIGISLGRWTVVSLYREAGLFLETAPDYIASLQEFLSAYSFIPATGLLDRAGEWLSAQSIRAVALLPELLISILLIFVSAFFFSRDREAIFALCKKWSPDWITAYTKPVGQRLHQAGIGFLKSEFIVISIVAVVCICALWIMGNPYAIMLGLIIAIFDALPIVGAGLILWPWAAYLALTGGYSQATGLMVLFGIITVIQNIIGPRILGDQIEMHPLAALMSIFIGIKAFGAIGVLAGPAMVLAAQAMLNGESSR